MLLEKFNRKNSTSIRILPGGYNVRRNWSDLNVILSMPFEYGILELTLNREKCTVVDAGANIGAFALYMKSFADVRSYIGIEPSPENFNILQTNLNVLGAQFAGINCAVTDHSKTVHFDISGSPSQYRQVTQGGIDIPGASLDEIESIAALETIDVLKIDVEGSELEVIKGASNTLRKSLLALIEIHIRELGEKQTEELFEIMSEQFTSVIYQQSPDLFQKNALFVRNAKPRVP
jgi:FkbM family methyltransferase